QIVRGDVAEELDLTKVRHFEDGGGGSAVHLFAVAQKALHHGSLERRVNFRPRLLELSEREQYLGLLERRLINARLRARVFQVLAGGDAALKKILVARQAQLGVLQIRLRLRHGRFGLLDLIEERTVLDLCETLSRADAVAF